MFFARMIVAFGLAACLGLSITGCIQEDPQIEALQSRLERAEERLETVGNDSQSGASESTGEFQSTISNQAAEIADLRAQVQRLETENSQLKSKGADGDSAILEQQALLANLDEASKPLREKIRPLYEIERAVLKELSVPESPYSCVVHLELINLATQAREEVDVPATANLKGEWRFPPIDQIATKVRARGQAIVGPVPAVNPGSQGPPGGGAAQPPILNPGGGGNPTGGNHQENPRQSPTPPPRQPGAVPAGIPEPGEVQGTIRLNW